MPSPQSRLIPSRPRPAHAACLALKAAAALVLMLAVDQPVRARWSDPVRNMHPEEPAAPHDVQHPIYYVLPIASARDPEGVSPEALLQQFLDKHSALNYPAAAEAALRLINLVPDRPAGYYNLACAMARMQRTDEAFDALRQAVKHGWREALHMSVDADLASLRSDPRFEQIVSEVKARAAAERIQPAPLREDAWEAVAADLSRETPGLLKRYGVPGATIALIDNGQVVWSAAFGMRDARSDDALSVDDRFRLRAPLHMLAVAACGNLEQENKIQLAALIRDAANQYAMVVADPPARNGEDGPLATPAANVRTTGDRSTDRDKREPGAGRAPPSRTRTYSRASVYGLLRLAVESAAGENFPRYCERTILQPLNLRSTTFAMRDESERIVTGHSHLGTPLRPSVIVGEFAPGGAVYISAGDLARLVAQSMAEPAAVPEQGMFMEDDEARGHGPAVRGARCAKADDGQACATNFDDTQWRRLVSGALDLVTRVDAALPGGLGMALQQRDQQAGEGACIELRESASGIECLARWHPQTRRGIVILANSATARDAADRIAHLALGGD